MRPLLEESNISLFEVSIDVSLVNPSVPAKIIIFFCMKGRDRTLLCTSSAVMYCTILVPLKIEFGQRKFHGEKLVLSGLTYDHTRHINKLASLVEIEDNSPLSLHTLSLADTVPRQSLALAHFHVSSISKEGKYAQITRSHCAELNLFWVSFITGSLNMHPHSSWKAHHCTEQTSVLPIVRSRPSLQIILDRSSTPKFGISAFFRVRGKLFILQAKRRETIRTHCCSCGV